MLQPPGLDVLCYIALAALEFNVTGNMFRLKKVLLSTFISVNHRGNRKIKVLQFLLITVGLYRSRSGRGYGLQKHPTNPILIVQSSEYFSGRGLLVNI